MPSAREKDATLITVAGAIFVLVGVALLSVAVAFVLLGAAMVAFGLYGVDVGGDE